MELSDALERSREMIKAALADARTELESLREREAQLEEQIAEAEAALGDTDGSAAASTQQLTLHEAIASVLREHGNRWMTARELAAEVTRKGLYRKRDGTPVEVNQVHARTANYEALFEKKGPKIRLKESPVLAELPSAIQLFRDDDGGFFEWVESHPDGYFLNTYRNPSPNYLVLHRSGGCGHFKSAPSVQWTRDYIKLCSKRSEDLETWAGATWADEADPAQVTLCRDCFR
jgi:hypothetical protein